MAKFSIVAGATSETVDIFVQDSTSTTGAGLTGLVFNAAGLTCYYNTRRGASTAVTLATLAAATSAWSSGGFKEIDATNQPGKYRLDLPNALLASGNGRYVGVYLQGAANMAPVLLEIELTGWDNQDGVRGGMTALPNAAANATGGLATVIRGGTAQAGGNSTITLDSGASATNGYYKGTWIAIVSGTGAGQCRFIGGYTGSTKVATVAPNWLTNPDNTSVFVILPAAGVDVEFWLAAAPVAVNVSGVPVVDVVDWKGATAPAMTGDAFARLGAPAGASVSADIAGVPAALLATVVYGARTLGEWVKLVAAVLWGKSDGPTPGTAGTQHFRDEADSKNVITATTGTDSQRSAVTKNP